MNIHKDAYSHTLDKVSTGSAPSQLRITDIKICKVDLPPWGCNIIRIETNQGICGYGEMRDGASGTYVKILKSRLVGENPCDVDRLFRKIKQFGGHSRQSAGICAVELALWDLAGKAYGVPVYQLIGGRFRDRVRLYGDIHIEAGRFTGKLMDPKDVGMALKNYMDDGFTVLKILSVELLMYQEGNYCGPLDLMDAMREAELEGRRAAQKGDLAAVARVNARLHDLNRIPHPFKNMRVTEQGLTHLENYIEQIRSVTGYKIPLAIDHFGHFPMPDMIKIARRLERFNLAWLEDLIPWYLTDQLALLKKSTTAPIATGEDIYLAENFEPLLAAGALDLVHPDMLTAGGILETKKLGDLAEKYGVSMAVHMCESPVACIACSHMAVATENFFCLEYDAFDSPWWADLIIGPGKPILKQGFLEICNAPGLGIESLNDDLIREHGPIKDKNVWVSTDEWNDERSLDRIWS